MTNTAGPEWSCCSDPRYPRPRNVSFLSCACASIMARLAPSCATHPHLFSSFHGALVPHLHTSTQHRDAACMLRGVGTIMSEHAANNTRKQPRPPGAAAKQPTSKLYRPRFHTTRGTAGCAPRVPRPSWHAKLGCRACLALSTLRRCCAMASKAASGVRWLHHARLGGSSARHRPPSRCCAGGPRGRSAATQAPFPSGRGDGH